MAALLDLFWSYPRGGSAQLFETVDLCRMYAACPRHVRWHFDLCCSLLLLDNFACPKLYPALPCLALFPLLALAHPCSLHHLLSPAAFTRRGLLILAGRDHHCGKHKLYAYIDPKPHPFSAMVQSPLAILTLLLRCAPHTSKPLPVVPLHLYPYCCPANASSKQDRLDVNRASGTHVPPI